MRRLLTKYLIVFCASCSGVLYGQELYYVNRLTTPVDFDGMPFEAVWENMEPFELHQYEPVYDGEITDRTELFMTYDDDYVYFAARMYADPSLIMDTGKGRDLFKPNMDYFGVLLDTFNDYENALGFMTAPSGLRLDLTIANDAQGVFPLNSTWNTFWDVETVKSDSGWFAEMRIPWSSLRFQDNDGEVTMGFLIRRWMPAKSQVLMYPKVRNDLGNWSNWKPSQGKRIVFKGIHSRKPTYFTPYVLGGVQREMILNNSGDTYKAKVEPELNAGIDIKYGITSNLTMDITINPDFAQVEADDQQVNLTRFSLFFPEKRLFFQERASIFSFNMGGPNTIFYSRRIGLSEEEIIPIYGGVRLNGRIGKWDIGFLDMQTAGTSALSSTNYGVLRLRKQVFNNQSYMGGMIANQIDVNGMFNTAVGIDGIFRVFGMDYFNINFAHTYENNGVTTPFSMDHSKINMKWERRNTKGFGYDFGYNRAGIQYNPAMGFQNRENVTRIGNKIWWGWLPNDKSWLYSHALFIKGALYKKNTDWSTESGNIGLGWEFNSRNNWRGAVAMEQFEEGVTESFTIGDAEIPVGRYNFNGFTTEINTPFSSPVRLTLSSYVGSFFDGNRVTLGLNPVWSPSSSVELELKYEYNQGDFNARNQSYRIHLVAMKTRLMISNALSATLFVQYNSDNEEAVTNFRIRYNPREGNDLYIVFNDIMNTDRHNVFPELPFSSSRALILKYTYTFVWTR